VGDKLSKWMLGASPELGPIRSSRNETGKILCSYTTRPSPSDTMAACLGVLGSSGYNLTEKYLNVLFPRSSTIAAENGYFLQFVRGSSIYTIRNLFCILVHSDGSYRRHNNPTQRSLCSTSPWRMRCPHFPERVMSLVLPASRLLQDLRDLP